MKLTLTLFTLILALPASAALIGRTELAATNTALKAAIALKADTNAPPLFGATLYGNTQIGGSTMSIRSDGSGPSYAGIFNIGDNDWIWLAGESGFMYGYIGMPVTNLADAYYIPNIASNATPVNALVQDENGRVYKGALGTGTGMANPATADFDLNEYALLDGGAATFASITTPGALTLSGLATERLIRTDGSSIAVATDITSTGPDLIGVTTQMVNRVQAGSIVSSNGVQTTGTTRNGYFQSSGTNGISQLLIGLGYDASGTNELLFHISDMASGHSFAVHSKSTLGPTNIYVITNKVLKVDTNYAQASLTINSSTDVSAAITNAVGGNINITFSTPVIGTSFSISGISDGSARTITPLCASVTLKPMSTNWMSNSTNVLTVASKDFLICGRFSRGVNGVTNLHYWAQVGP